MLVIWKCLTDIDYSSHGIWNVDNSYWINKAVEDEKRKCWALLNAKYDLHMLKSAAVWCGLGEAQPAGSELVGQCFGKRGIGQRFPEWWQQSKWAGMCSDRGRRCHQSYRYGRGERLWQEMGNRVSSTPQPQPEAMENRNSKLWFLVLLSVSVGCVQSWCKFSVSEVCPLQTWMKSLWFLYRFQSQCLPGHCRIISSCNSIELPKVGKIKPMLRLNRLPGHQN